MSAIPAVLDALVDLARTSPALDLVMVYDGQPVETESDLLAIGHNPNGDAVDAQINAAGLASEAEVFEVSCWVRAQSFNGIEDIPNVRRRALAVYEDFAASLSVDPTLGDLVLECRPAVASLDQFANTDGVQASVTFVVRVSAFNH